MTRHPNAFGLKRTVYRPPTARIEKREDRFYATYANGEGEEVGSEYIDLDDPSRLPFELFYQDMFYRPYLVTNGSDHA